MPEPGPLFDEVVKCGKCGFCQPTCPVYRVTRHEGHVARGKNALMRNLIDGTAEPTPDLEDAFANCLLCRACTANCFSAVRTDQVVIGYRQTHGAGRGRAAVQRAVFRGLLPRPRLMRRLVQTTWALRRTRLVTSARRRGWVAMLNPKLERALELSGDPPRPLLRERLAARSPADPVRPRRLRVGYWISCGYDYVLPEVGEATVRVLERLGCQVEVLDNVCCGLAAHGYGDAEGARALARANIERLGDLTRFDAIVSECGSCSGQLKEYPLLFAEDREYEVRAGRLQGKVRSFSEFLVAEGGLELLGQGCLDSVVTYHDPCHLGARYQGVVDQPRALLRAIPGAELRELPEADWCCGAAGTYSVLHPETSGAIVDRKAENVRATEAEVLVTECPSCMLQLSLGVRRAGLDVEVRNVSQVCDEALRAGARL